MNRTTILRALMLVLFCAIASQGYAQVQNTTKSAPLVSSTPLKPQDKGANVQDKDAPQSVSAPGQPHAIPAPPVPAGVNPPKDMLKAGQQDRSVPPTTYRPVEIRSKDGKIEKALVKQEDIAAYYAKPSIPVEQRNTTNESMEKFKKDYQSWVSKNQNWQDLLSQHEIMLYQNNLWSQLYELAVQHGIKSKHNTPNQPNKK